MPTILTDALHENQEQAVNLVKDQLYSGLDGNLKLLTPSYSQDPFFKTREAALKYAKFKATQNPRTINPLFGAKPYDTPNLIVNGKFVYDRMRMVSLKDRVAFEIGGRLRNEIPKKYGKNTLKLSTKAVTYLKDNGVDDYVKRRIKYILYNGL